MPYTTEADLWSLGVCLALLLTGTHPFDGDTPLELKTSICKDSINMHEKPWTDLSPDACNLVSRMLEKDLTKRITIKEVSTTGVGACRGRATIQHLQCMTWSVLLCILELHIS